jgi:hypothetical protein
MIDIDTSDKNEQRKFGLLVGGVFGLIGLVRWGLHTWRGEDYFPTYLAVLAGVLIFFGVVWPKALQPIFVAWMKLAVVLNWIMTRLFLTIAFYGMITPVRFLIQRFGEDPLKRALLPPGATYWEAPEEQPADFNRYRKQY